MRYTFLLVSAVVVWSIGLALGADRAMTLNNATSRAVTGFLVKPPSGGELPVNVIAGSTIEPGAMLDVVVPSPDDACLFDLKIVFADTREVERPSVDFCNIDGYIIE